MAEPPPDPEALAALTELLGIALPSECVPGVLANLALLGEHLRNVEAFTVPGDTD